MENKTLEEQKKEIIDLLSRMRLNHTGGQGYAFIERLISEGNTHLNKLLEYLYYVRAERQSSYETYYSDGVIEAVEKAIELGVTFEDVLKHYEKYLYHLSINYRNIKRIIKEKINLKLMRHYTTLSKDLVEVQRMPFSKTLIVKTKFDMGSSKENNIFYAIFDGDHIDSNLYDSSEVAIAVALFGEDHKMTFEAIRRFKDSQI